MELTLGGHKYVLTDHRNAFINPATLEVYEWVINHSPEGDKGNEKKRAITTTANTGQVGLVRQQSADEPLILKREGEILDTSQEEQMWRWWNICKSQTIYFVEFNGDAYEVQITNYNPQRYGTGGPTRSGQRYYVKYSIEMEVYSILAGIAFSAGVTP